MCVDAGHAYGSELEAAHRLLAAGPDDPDHTDPSTEGAGLGPRCLSVERPGRSFEVAADLATLGPGAKAPSDSLAFRVELATEHADAYDHAK